MIGLKVLVDGKRQGCTCSQKMTKKTKIKEYGEKIKKTRKKMNLLLINYTYNRGIRIENKKTFKISKKAKIENFLNVFLSNLIFKLKNSGIFGKFLFFN